MSEYTTTTETSGSMGTLKLSYDGEWRTDQEVMRLSDGPMFVLAVRHFNELIFFPKTALAQSLLAMWAHAGWGLELQMRHTPDPAGWRYGAGIERATLRMQTRPMLSSGDDPYYTGMSLTPEELKVARAAVDRMRQSAHKAARRERNARKRNP